jgi:chromosome segregation ATPase
MIKKLGITAVAVLGVLFLLNTTGLGSYATVAFNKIKGGFKRQVPLEFEIECIRHEIAQLVPDMKKNLSAVAEEMVAIENLREEIVVAKTNLEKERNNIFTMKQDLESGAQTISYGGRNYSANRIREKLTADFASYQRAEAEVKSKEQLLEAKEHSLDIAREQLATIRTQKQELETQVAQLEADVKQVRLAQCRNKFHFDDSRLARVKASLADLRNRLKVEKTEQELAGQFANDNTIPVEKKAKSTKELSKEINAYFQPEGGADKVAESK